MKKAIYVFIFESGTLINASIIQFESKERQLVILNI